MDKVRGGRRTAAEYFTAINTNIYICRLALSESKDIDLEADKAELVDHLLWRVPELRNNLTELCIDALKVRRYDILRRLILRDCALDKPELKGGLLLDVLLGVTEDLPGDLYGAKRLPGEKSKPLTMMQKEKLSPAHKKALEEKQSPWVVMLLDEKNQTCCLELASKFPKLQEQIILPSVLLLAMVPKLVSVAHWLLKQGEDDVVKRKGGRGFAQFDDGQFLATIQEPNKDGSTAWFRLQMDNECSKFVNYVMLNVPALGSISVFLDETHAARAADLIEESARENRESIVSVSECENLLKEGGSKNYLKKMSWLQAACSPGAVVIESPHPHSVNTDLRQPVSLPGAKKIYVAFDDHTSMSRRTARLSFLQRMADMVTDDDIPDQVSASEEQIDELGMW